MTVDIDIVATPGAPEDQSGDNVLGEIAIGIHEAWDAAKESQLEAFEGYLKVGRLLGDARSRFTRDIDYGHWFAGQDFGFSTTWGRRLRLLAVDEQRVRMEVESALATSTPIPGVDGMLRILAGKNDQSALRPDRTTKERIQQRAGARVIGLERKLHEAKRDATAESADVQVTRFRWVKSVLERLESVTDFDPSAFVRYLTVPEQNRTREAAEDIRDWASWTLAEIDEQNSGDPGDGDELAGEGN